MIPLLQQSQLPVTGFGEFDPRITAIMIGALIVVIIAGVINAILSGGGGRASQRFSKRAFHRRGRRIGLSRQQANALLYHARQQAIVSPMRLLQDGPLLDRTVRDALADIDEAVSEDQERERRKAELFQIRTMIAIHTQNTARVQSSRSLRLGQEAKMSIDGRSWHGTTVSSQTTDRFGIEVPYDEMDRPFRLRRGTGIRLRFQTDSGHLYTFSTSVLGHGIARRVPTLFLAHGERISRVQQRKYPRREFRQPCYFYPVSVVTVGRGRRAKRQAVVNQSDRRFGRFEDLSAGGAAIRAQRPLKPKSLLKVEFETADGLQVAVFGKIRGLQRDPYRSGLMHVMFSGVSRKQLNAIQSYVFGYVDDYART